MHFLLITTLIWAFSFGLIGNKLEGLDAVIVGSLRLMIALLIFISFLRPARVNRSEQVELIFIGAVQFGVMYTCYLSAFRYLPSHLVALFSVSTPIYVVLIHEIRQRQFNIRYLLAALLSVAGASVIKAKADTPDTIWKGFILMQCAGIAFAFGQVKYRDWRSERPSLKDRDIFGFLYAGGAVTALFFSLLLSPKESLMDVSLQQWGVILYLGAVASGLGFFLWNKGSTLCSAGALAAFNNAVVPMAMAVSLFVFREIEDTTTSSLIRLFIGAALIASAVAIGNKSAECSSCKSGSLSSGPQPRN